MSPSCSRGELRTDGGTSFVNIANLQSGRNPVITSTRLGGRWDADPQARLRLQEESGAGGTPASGFESTSTPDVLRDSHRGQNLRHCYCATGLLRDESPDAQIETITVPLSGYHPFSASYFQISSSAPSHRFGPRLHRRSVCDPTTQSYPSPLLLRASFASSSPFSADLVWAERRS